MDYGSTYLEVQHLMFYEAAALDACRWDDWLALFTIDAIYWVPAWKNENTLVSDVESEVSLIFHQSRRELEERVYRLRSQKSVTTAPLPRTVHLVTNIMVEDSEGDSILASAAWQVNSFDPRTTLAKAVFGRYYYQLRREDKEMRITKKKVVIMNDVIDTIVDIYNI